MPPDGGGDARDARASACEGRMWRYADGGLAFVWLPGGGAAEAMVEYDPVPVEHVS